MNGTGASPFDLAHLDLSGMIQCGRALRELTQQANSMEAAAQQVVERLRDTFRDPVTGASDCVLVRCFKTHRLNRLPQDLQVRARAALSSPDPALKDATLKDATLNHATLNDAPIRGLPPNDPRLEDLPCLTLLGSAGDLEEWNLRTQAGRHAVLPLESVELVERAPMIAQLILQMGLEIGTVLNPSPDLLVESDQRAYGVFYVPQAVGSPFLPAQDFVLRHKVQSVLGFGGLLPSGDLFAVILFSRAPISREIANLFRTLALSVKLVLLPFTGGPVFAEEALPGTTLPKGYDDEQIRSELATLRLLIPALEDAALAQTNRLEGAVTDLELRAGEVRQLGLRLSSVLDSTTDAVFRVDREWRFTYLNQHAENLLHRDQTLLGSNLWKEFPAAAGSSFWDNYHRAVDEKVAVSFEEYYPAPLDLWFDVHAFPSDGGLAIFFRDITESRLAAQALLRNEKLAAVGRLAASIAHEINNPLESVTNLLYLAQGSDDMTELKQYLTTADRELRRIGAITSQTLRFHRQSSNPTEVHPAELVIGALSMYQGRIASSRVEVKHRSRARRRVVCLEGELRQVLNNLVANALDAMQAGGCLSVRDREGTDWKTARQGVFLSVFDNGAGMSEQVSARIFEAFYSTKGVGGTGLGLWITRGIVDRHEGRITLRSSRRKGRSGTVFAVFLPFESGLAAAVERARARREQNAGAEATPPA